MKYLLLLLIFLFEIKPGLAADFICAGFLSPEGAAPEERAAPKPVQYGMTGTRSVLVIFAQFPNEDPVPVPGWSRDIFDPELPGSFSHFYDTMSFGQLQVRGEVGSRRYPAQQPASSYLPDDPAEPGNYGWFALEILQQADRDIDFSHFDNDGPDRMPNSGDDDGLVDYIFLNLLSVPPGFLYGPATGIVGLGFEEDYLTADRSVGGDPIRISGSLFHGTLLEEGNFAQTVGSMAHEFGHSLELPDLYDISFLDTPDQDPTEDSAGIGRWGLMGWGAHGWNGDDGPNGFCAWSLEQLGWIGQDNVRLVEIRRDIAELPIQDLFREGVIYKIPLPLETLGPGAEESSYTVDLTRAGRGYLLLELRQRSSHYYNRHLPAEGLLIWHVRYQVRKNAQEGHKQVDLVCADGRYADRGYPQGKIPDPYGGGDNLDFWAHDAAYRQAHGGNLGDATDPFDGMMYTRFDLHSNPSTLSSLWLKEASTGLSLRFSRRPDGTLAATVQQPRWAGTIREEVHWANEVRVDGDLTIAPEGRLVLHSSTRVLLAGADRLQGGRDPDHCEVHVQGGFVAMHSTDPLVLEALHPGETWYGLIVDPATCGQILVSDENLILRDALNGIVMPGAPPGAQGLVLGESRLIDAPETETAGNDDGQLNPGETFKLALELNNWSLTRYRQVSARLRWDSPGVVLTGKAPLTKSNITAFAVVHVGCKPWIFLEERQQLSPCLT